MAETGRPKHRKSRDLTDPIQGSSQQQPNNCGADYRGASGRGSNKAELRVIPPETPPRISDRAARVLLRILLNARARRGDPS